MNQKFYYFFDHTKIISCYFFKSGFEIRISCKRINEWLKQDLWLLRQSDSSLLANVVSVTKGGGNYPFSKQFFTFNYLTVKFVGNLCKWHSDPEFRFHSEITEKNQELAFWGQPIQNWYFDFLYTLDAFYFINQ